MHASVEEQKTACAWNDVVLRKSGSRKSLLYMERLALDENLKLCQNDREHPEQTGAAERLTCISRRDERKGRCGFCVKTNERYDVR